PKLGRTAQGGSWPTSGHEACTRILAEEPPQEVEMVNVLIVHASRYGQTEKVAQRIAAMLRTRGHDVLLLDAAHPPRALEWQRFQVVFVGAPVYAGNYLPPIVRFVREHRDFLQRVRSAFFSVNLAI